MYCRISYLLYGAFWQVLEDGRHVHRLETAGRAGKVWSHRDLGHRGLRGAAGRQGALGLRVGKHAALGGWSYQGGYYRGIRGRIVDLVKT